MFLSHSVFKRISSLLKKEFLLVNSSEHFIRLDDRFLMSTPTFLNIFIVQLLTLNFLKMTKFLMRSRNFF